MTERRRFIATAGGVIAATAAAAIVDARNVIAQPKVQWRMVHQRVATAIEALADLEEVGPLTLKGLLRPVSAFNVVRLKGTI